MLVAVMLGADETTVSEGVAAEVEEDAAAEEFEEEGRDVGELVGTVLVELPVEVVLGAPVVTGGVLGDTGLPVEVAFVVPAGAACADATGTAAVGRIKLKMMAMADAHDQTRDRRDFPVACRVSAAYIRVLLAVVWACAIVRVLLC